MCELLPANGLYSQLNFLCGFSRYYLCMTTAKPEPAVITQLKSERLGKPKT